MSTKQETVHDTHIAEVYVMDMFNCMLMLIYVLRMHRTSAIKVMVLQ